MDQIYQIQQQIQRLRQEVNSISQAANQMQQFEQGTSQQLQQLTQRESMASQNLQRIQQLASTLSQEINNIGSITQQLGSQMSQIQRMSPQYPAGFGSQHNYGQFGTGFTGQQWTSQPSTGFTGQSGYTPSTFSQNFGQTGYAHSPATTASMSGQGTSGYGSFNQSNQLSNQNSQFAQAMSNPITSHYSSTNWPGHNRNAYGSELAPNLSLGQNFGASTTNNNNLLGASSYAFSNQLPVSQNMSSMGMSNQFGTSGYTSNLNNLSQYRSF